MKTACKPKTANTTERLRNNQSYHEAGWKAWQRQLLLPKFFFPCQCFTRQSFFLKTIPEKWVEGKPIAVFQPTQKFFGRHVLEGHKRFRVWDPSRYVSVGHLGSMEVLSERARIPPKPKGD